MGLERTPPDYRAQHVETAQRNVRGAKRDGSRNSATLLTARSRAQREENLVCLGLTVSYGFGSGLIATFLTLDILGLNTFSSLMVPILWFMALSITALVALLLKGSIRSWSNSHYKAAEKALRETNLAELILDEGYLFMVIAKLNSKSGLFKVKPPKSFEEQVRFAGEYWAYYMGIIQPGWTAPPTALERILLRPGARPNDSRLERIRAASRRLAICDFFVREQW